MWLSEWAELLPPQLFECKKLAHRSRTLPKNLVERKELAHRSRTSSTIECVYHAHMHVHAALRMNRLPPLT